MTSYAVIDAETTGFGKADRVVEIGVVLLDPDGVREGTWETLLNPSRDIGPQHIHHIDCADILDAPRFADVVGDLTAVLRNRVVVGHNIAFDARMLSQEYERVGLPLGLAKAHCVCTQTLARRTLALGSYKLGACCEAVGVTNARAHSALADAEATAGLFTRLCAAHGGLRKADAVHGFASRSHEVPWPILPAGNARLVTRGNGRAMLESSALPVIGWLTPGDLVVFTGAGVIPRHDLEKAAIDAGLRVHSGVTKAVKAVVAADKNSLSGKAAKARSYGLPILSGEEFLELIRSSV